MQNSDYTFLEMMPREENYDQFEAFPKSIYPERSPRFLLGNDPVEKHLVACFLMFQNGLPKGRFAFYENKDLKYQDKSTACIGSYECVDDLAASTALINHAKALAKSKGYAWLIGPMEGSTWNNYRFSTHNDEANFFMEPYHHVYYNEQFVSAGLEPIATYVSKLDTSLNFDLAGLEKFESDCKEKGFVFRGMNLAEFENDLALIGSFCLDGFSDNFLYTPISVAAFVEKYKPLKALFDPEIVQIMEDREGNIQALIFAINDIWDVNKETMILKTIVKRKDSPIRGFAKYLVGKINSIAVKRGYTKVIHALMIEENISNKVSGKLSAKTYKEYQLFGFEL